MKRALYIALLLWPIAGTAWPIDQIYMNTTDKPKFGQIVGMTPTTVNLKSLKSTDEIPVNEIKRIIYENSPPALLDAQKSVLDGDYGRALDLLKGESTADKREEIAQEIAFIRAYCTSKLTVSGEKDITEAGQEVAAFLKTYPNSCHFYKACELMGDLCVAAGKFEAAQGFYSKLSQSPWPDYKILAQVALGRAYLAQDNAAGADKAFDEALANSAGGDLAETQRTAARIGKTRCMILKGQADAAIGSLNDIIDKLGEGDAELHALAYNALGTALRKAGKPDKAILAFLHVHLKYDDQPEAHAEAVANLERLFTDAHKPDHAGDMHRILMTEYKNTRWANGVK